MVDTEEYFPRGGKKPTTTYFKQSENFLGAPEKGEKKRKRPKKKSEDDDGYLSDDLIQEVDQSYKTCGIYLNYKVVKAGLLLLGRVRQVFETKINVSLPCRMNGVVMACHISEAYNNLLEAYVNDKVEHVRELPKMFRPGQYVAVKVLEGSDKLLTLSMMPQHIYDDRKASTLHKGALLQAAVTSIEDHGYVMDIGIPNTRAFLAKNTVNPEHELDIGMLTWVTIKSLSADFNVVTLTSELGALQRSFQRNPGVIYPGTAMDFTVHKALDNGIEGHILGDKLAYIQRHQVGLIKGKKPVLGQKIRARLLYSVPPQHIPFFTTRGVFDSDTPDLADEQQFQDGDIIEDAQVLKTWGHSVLLRLSPGSTGVLSLRRGGHDPDEGFDIAKSYPIGSGHKVRVLCYSPSDALYSVSDAAEVLQQRYFALRQLSVGQLLRGTVSELGEQHARLAVGRLSGYVPRAHMTETGVFVDPKKATASKVSKKYKLGQELQARVLSLDQSKNSLVLTLKPSLLQEELPLLMDYSEEHVGKAYTGVISHIKHYLLVSFFNNVAAYVPARHAGAEPGGLATSFHIGQIVKCTIMSVKPEVKKMSGSLTAAPFEPYQNGKKRAAKRKNNDENAEKSKSSDPDDTVNENQTSSSDDEDDQTPEETIQKAKRQKKAEKSNDTTEVNESEDNVTLNTETLEESDIKSTKKKRKDKNNDKLNKNNLETKDKVQVNSENEHSDSKKKKKSKDKEVSEESDEIETDIQDDIDSFTPQEQSLVDLSDLGTEKQCKKRVVSLLKAINARTKRVSRVEKKIAAIENKGVTRNNKKFHTAMNLEKLNNEERAKNLMRVLIRAQELLKGFRKEAEMEKEKEETKKKEKEETKTVNLNKKMENLKQKETQKIVKEKVKKDDSKKVESLKVRTLEPVLKVPSAKEFWSIEEKKTEDVNDDSSSSDEEEQEKPKKKRKKLSVAEKAAKAREEEERLREMERRAIESESSPRSSEQFERALLAQPDCSQLWIAYMAFHLQSTEMEKARAVARRALTTINFREEGEKLNVWLALLNLEHRFGTKETQKSALEEALQMNETYKIHSKLLDILVDTSKQQELATLVELMMRRYKNLEAYAACGAACYKAGLVDKARHVMQKGITVLEKKEHVPLVVRFAMLERSRGAPEGRERAEALLEQTLAAYPQRLDVAGVYCDMLAKDGDAERVRQLMERMTSQNLPARKMKVLYKKWIEVEQKIGDEQHAESVRQSAIKFLDRAKF